MPQVARISGPLLAANLKRTQSNLSVDNDLLYIGHLTGKVGIRTASQASELDIFGQTISNDFMSDRLTGGNLKVDTTGVTAIVGDIILDSQGTIHADELHTENLTFNDNYIGSKNNSDIVLDTNGTGTVEFPKTKVTGTISTTGNITIPGNITVGGTMNLGDEPTDTISFNFAELSQDFTPHTTAGAYSLGSPTRVWNNVSTSQATIGDIEIDNDYITTKTLNNNLTLRPSGTGSIVIDDVAISGHNLISSGSSWNVNTGTFSGFVQPTNPSLSNYKTGGISFSPDGTKCFVSAEVNQTIRAYICTTPWDISSINAGAVVTAFDTSTETQVGASPFNGLVGHFWRPDGTKLFVSGGYGDTGSDQSRFFAYEVSIAWDITQCQFTGEASFLGISKFDAPNFHMSPDGRYIFWMYYDSTWKIIRYELSTPWDLTTTGSSQNIQLSTFHSGTEGNAIWFNNSGTKLYLVDFDEVVHTFVLAVGFDLNTITSVGVTKNVGAQEGTMPGAWTSAMAMTFKHDGARLYVVGLGASGLPLHGSIKQFALDIARDLVITPGSGNITISSVAALNVPDGTEAQRPSSNRDVRYNTTTNFFELFSTAYTPLRGIWSEDRQTYVLANAGNDFSFVTNGVTTTTLSTTGLTTNKLISQNTVEIDGNTISSATTNADFNLTATGVVNIANFKFNASTIHNTVAQPFKLSKTGNTGYVQFDANVGMVIPAGSTAQRPIGIIGQTRFNTDLAYMETYDGTDWANIAGVGGGITEQSMEELGNIYTIALA